MREKSCSTRTISIKMGNCLSLDPWRPGLFVLRRRAEQRNDTKIVANEKWLCACDRSSSQRTGPMCWRQWTQIELTRSDWRYLSLYIPIPTSHSTIHILWPMCVGESYVCVWFNFIFHVAAAARATQYGWVAEPRVCPRYQHSFSSVKRENECWRNKLQKPNGRTSRLSDRRLE